MTALTREKIAELRKLYDEAKDKTDAGYLHALGKTARDQLLPMLLDLAASLSAGEGSGMETTAEERASWRAWGDQSKDNIDTFGVRASNDIDRLLALSAKAREEEREACAQLVMQDIQDSVSAEVIFSRTAITAAIRARSKS